MVFIYFHSFHSNHLTYALYVHLATFVFVGLALCGLIGLHK